MVTNVIYAELYLPEIFGQIDIIQQCLHFLPIHLGFRIIWAAYEILYLSHMHSHVNMYLQLPRGLNFYTPTMFASSKPVHLRSLA